jgi:hypothetical protein
MHHSGYRRLVAAAMLSCALTGCSSYRSAHGLAIAGVVLQPAGAVTVGVGLAEGSLPATYVGAGIAVVAGWMTVAGLLDSDRHLRSLASRSPPRYSAPATATRATGGTRSTASGEAGAVTPLETESPQGATAAGRASIAAFSVAASLPQSEISPEAVAYCAAGAMESCFELVDRVWLSAPESVRPASPACELLSLACAANPMHSACAQDSGVALACTLD